MNEKIITIISTVSKKSALEINQHLESKNLWDSFSHLELVLALEDEFGIMLEAEEISEMVTPSLVIKTVEEKMK